jgi:hypothetical protein
VNSLLSSHHRQPSGRLAGKFLSLTLKQALRYKSPLNTGLLLESIFCHHNSGQPLELILIADQAAPLAPVGMRSLYGAAFLDASFSCFCGRAIALSELKLFPATSPAFTFAHSLDVHRRIARERVPTSRNGVSPESRERQKRVPAGIIH